MKRNSGLLLTVWLCVQLPASGQVPSPLHGITVDNVKNLPEIVASIGDLSQKMTTRIVYDRGKKASGYRQATAAIRKVSYVMGEIVDSFYMKCYTVPEYLDRTKDYVDTLSDVVDIWEVGNEINGDWTFGSTRNCKPKAHVKSTTAADVARKMVGAYDYVKSKGKIAELTLYYNIDRYYRMHIDQPNFVGGYFWWYFRQDMVPYQDANQRVNPMWQALNDAISGK